MRSIDKVDTGFESRSDQIKAGRHHPSRTVSFKRYGKVRTIKISAGTEDQVWLFQEGYDLIVLSINYLRDYAGIEVFDVKNLEPVPDHELFIQHEWEAEEIVGKPVDQLSKMTLVKRMYKWLTDRL